MFPLSPRIGSSPTCLQSLWLHPAAKKPTGPWRKRRNLDGSGVMSTNNLEFLAVGSISHCFDVNGRPSHLTWLGERHRDVDSLFWVPWTIVYSPGWVRKPRGGQGLRWSLDFPLSKMGLKRWGEEKEDGANWATAYFLILLRTCVHMI